MADFCTRCSEEMFGPEMQPDINVEQIAESLKPGYYQPVLCEGCAMLAVVKEDDGSIKLAFSKMDDTDEVRYETIEEWREKPKSICIMKRFNEFFDKAPLIQVYIAGWFLSGAFTILAFYVLGQLGEVNHDLIKTNGIVCIKVGAATCLLFGLIIMMSVSMMRKSQIFWEYSHEVEALIDNATTRAQLESIFENEFQALRKKCQGGPQVPELNRLYTIMKTKIKYLK